MVSISNIYKAIATDLGAAVSIHSATDEKVAALRRMLPEAASSISSLSPREVEKERLDEKILSILVETYPDENGLIIKYLGLGDEWVTEGDKATAVKKIIDAYKSGSTDLDLRLLGLSSLPKGIGKLTSLTNLYLSHNQLTSIPAEIGKLINLKSLDISNNKLTTLPAEIGNLTNLTDLFISYNQLEKLPAEIGELINLKDLYLSNNKLTTLPAEIGKLTNLTYLSISYNQLEKLPAEIGKLTNLSLLYLLDNQLETLPVEIGELKNLSSLYLSNNKLKTLPAEIGELTNLEFLYLEKNQLEKLPAQIGKLTNLIALELNNNQLKELPEEIGRLTNLRSLDLNNNKLTKLPEKIGGLTNLVSLGLNNNQLKILPAQFWQLTNLASLFLENNQLETLPADIEKFKGLRILSLFNNKFTILPFEQLSKLTNLEKLNYSGNNIEQEPQLLPPNLTEHLYDNNPFVLLLLPPDPKPTDIIECFSRVANVPVPILPTLDLNLIDSNLHHWLTLLVMSEDFTTGSFALKVHFASRALAVLKYASENPNYKVIFDEVLSDPTCNDRATLALDNLEIHKEIEKAGGYSEANAIEVLTKAYIIEILDQIAREKLPTLLQQHPRMDEIEVYLAYHVKVGERLGRRLGSQTMTSESYSFLTERDYNAAYDQVQNALNDKNRMGDFFVKQNSWRQFLDKQFVSEKDVALKDITQEWGQLEEREDLTSGELTAKFDALQARRKEMEDAWYLKKTEALLSKSRR